MIQIDEFELRYIPKYIICILYVSFDVIEFQF